MHSAALVFFASALAAQSSSISAAPPAQGAISVAGNAGTPSDDASLRIATMRNTLGIATGTPIEVHLDSDIDSAHATNGQKLHGKLAKAAGNAAAGSPVELTVVAVAAAGQMSSAGEISLQIARINGQDELSQVITTQGKPGPRPTADAAPAKGTEASISAQQTLIFPAY